MRSFLQHLQEKQIIVGKGAKYGQVVFLAGGAGCHVADTPILMFDGSLKMSQHIEVGDVLMGPDSSPRNVISLHTGVEETVEVVSTKGDRYRVNRNHIHSFVCSFSKCGFVQGNVYNMTYDEWLELPKSAKKSLKIYKSPAIEFKSSSCVIDPYILGMWLGDGVRSNTNIIIDDLNICLVEEIENRLPKGYRLNRIKSHHENCSVWSIVYDDAHRKNDYRTYLTQRCFNGIDKRIPEEYLTNDIGTRQQVLAGLIDSDGYNGGGYYEIVTKFDGLKDDIYRLASSLGYQVTVTDKFALWNEENKKYHRISISGSFEDLPVVLPYKKCSKRRQIKNVLHQGFNIIETEEEEEYFGFEVDRDNLYVMGNFIVTHNSGKGFATKQYMEGDKFKVRDVDEYKRLFMKLADLRNKYPEIQNLNLSNPKDASKLHAFVKKTGVKNKSLELLILNARQGRLPNIVFDITLKDQKNLTDALPLLMSAGYDPTNIHIIWILTNYAVAVKQNRNPDRGRVVADDIVLKTHEGAANEMYRIVTSTTPKGIDGGVYIALGGRNAEGQVFWTDKDGKIIKTGPDKSPVIKSFSYLVAKEPGKPMKKDKVVQQQIFDWIKKNAPRTWASKYLEGPTKVA